MDDKGDDDDEKKSQKKPKPAPQQELSEGSAQRPIVPIALLVPPGLVSPTTSTSTQTSTSSSADNVHPTSATTSIMSAPSLTLSQMSSQSALPGSSYIRQTYFFFLTL